MLLQNISKSYDGIEILNDASLHISPGQKVALVGSNGAGKSTLLKIIAGLIEPDTGLIQLNDNRIGYLPQEIEINSQETVESYIKRVTGISELESKMSELEKDLDDVKKMDKYNTLQSAYANIDGYTFEHRMDTILKGFNLDSVSTTRPLNSLSGGQKSKVALASLLLQKFDLLLLDEPTNNLDLSAVIWLESFLKKTNASCLIISHDRYFLDKLVTKVFEIEWYDRNIVEYTGSYSDYLKQKNDRISLKKEQHEKQEKERKRLTKSIREKKQWAMKGAAQTTSDNDKYIKGYRRDRSTKVAKDAKSLEKQMDQMNETEIEKQRPKLTIPLVADNNRAKHAIMLESACVKYPSGFQLGPINLQINYGTRIGIIGPNGSGKSTLLNLISGKCELTSGEIRIGKSLTFGNLMQAHENMSRDKTIIDFFHDNTVTNKQTIYFTLSKFHFSADDLKKKIGTLSPGERARVLLALFSALSVNVLLLDEPTNHLDSEVIQALEHTLDDYTGTVIFISHDRFFLQTAKPDKLFIVSDGNIELIDNYTDYIDSLTSEAEQLIASLP